MRIRKVLVSASETVNLLLKIGRWFGSRVWLSGIIMVDKCFKQLVLYILGKPKAVLHKKEA